MSPPDIIALRGISRRGAEGPHDFRCPAQRIADRHDRAQLPDRRILRACPAARCCSRRRRQLLSALATIELDGVARRMLLCPPDLDWDRLQVLLEQAGIDTIVTDRPLHRCGAGKRTIIGIDLPERRAVGRKIGPLRPNG